MSRNDEKNFRTHYYERVGFKGLDEKKTLDTLLNEDPRSIEKLQQFCLRFTMPSMMRLETWKIIYEFSSLYVKNASEKLWWKETPYYHIKRVERQLQKTTEDMTLPQEMAVQFLLRRGWIKFDVKTQLTENDAVDFQAIATSMLKITDNSEVASFYLSQAMFNFLHSDSEKIINDCSKYFHKVLSSKLSSLYCHCEKIGLFDVLPLNSWIQQAFAGILDEDALVKIWDKVVGGSYKILVFLAISLMETYGTHITRCHHSSEVLQLFQKINEETSHVVVQKAIDTWTLDGCQILVFDCPRSTSRDESKAKNISK